MIRNKKVARALQYSIRNPHAKLGEVAEKFGIRVSQLYHVRNYHGTVSPVTGVKAKRVNKDPVKWVNLLTTSEKPADMVNHPPHYKAGGIETIDFIEAKGLNYNLGNVVKYITRSDLKGNRVEDLKKALWYLQRELGAK